MTRGESPGKPVRSHFAHPSWPCHRLGVVGSHRPRVLLLSRTGGAGARFSDIKRLARSEPIGSVCKGKQCERHAGWFAFDWVLPIVPKPFLGWSREDSSCGECNVWAGWMPPRLTRSERSQPSNGHGRWR